MAQSIQTTDRLKTVLYYLLTLQAIPLQSVLKMRNRYGDFEPLFQSKNDAHQVAKQYFSKLKKAGLVKSYQVPIVSKRGRPEVYYMLTFEGLSLASQVCALSLMGRHKPISKQFIMHHLAVSDTVLESRKISPDILFLCDFNYSKNDEKNESLLTFDLPIGRLTPDIRFVKNKQDNLFIEIDMATESPKIIEEKFTKYHYLYDEIETFVDGVFKNLIFVVPSENRLKSLKSLSNFPDFAIVTTKENFPKLLQKALN